LGASFDCASIKEVKQLLDLGVGNDRIIFANPYKSLRTIEFHKHHGVRRLVFDSEDELAKLLHHYPNAELVLRIATDDSQSAAPLSSKFGAPMAMAETLIDQAARKNARLIGISFHVGSNCAHVPSYEKALLDAASLLTKAREKLAMSPMLLDLGGGFPGANDDAFIAIAKAINEILARAIPSDVQVIAEPGSFFATQSTSALVRIIGQKQFHEGGSTAQHLFLASGVYGLFFCGYYKNYDASALRKYGWQFQPLYAPRGGDELMRTTLWGPTCDAVDKIVEDILLPKVATGSWLYTHNIGSYAYAIESDFNQIDRSTPLYIRVENF
jgi:ornithine decarboxylase